MVAKVEALQVGGLKFESAESTDNLSYKGLLWGQSGAGKSWLAASAPNPFILLTEANGRQSIRLSNGKARIVQANDINAVREFLKAAAEDKLRALGCETIVIDSLTEVQRLMKDEILAKRGAEGMQLQDWGELTERMRRFMRMLRDVPYHVICVALENSEADESSGSRSLFPAFEGKKLHNEIAQYFNFVGYVYKRDKTDEKTGERQVTHGVMLEGPSRYLVKPCHPLTGIVQGPITEWFKVLTDGKKKE
jgi:hypothetical protein